jgi:hypothetical protein
MMNLQQRELESLRDQAMKLLEQEDRAMHTGEMGVRLCVATYKVHSALHAPLQRGLVLFHSSEGYSLPPRGRAASSDDGQMSLGGGD